MLTNINSCHCNLNPIASQSQGNNLKTNHNDNQGNTSFNASNGLGDESSNSNVVMGLIIILVQLLMQQLSNGQEQQSGQNGNTAPLDFSDKDKGLLLDAIGVGANAGTQVNRVDDVDASTTLNGGDNIELQTDSNLANHSVTDAESRQFIELRNPPGTVELPLSSQQSTVLENRYNAENISIADNNADSRISIGDFLTGFQTQGDRKVQIDIPVDAALVALLNA